MTNLSDGSNTLRRGRPVGSTAPSTDIVKRVRLASGLTQEEMARELGASISTVRRAEQKSVLPVGAAIRANLVRLAKKAGVEVSERPTSGVAKEAATQ